MAKVQNQQRRSDALNKAKDVSEAEKVREGGALRTQTTPAPQLRKTEEDAEGDHLHERSNMVSPRIPGSFDFEDYGGAAHAGTVDPFDAVGIIDDLRRRMQLRG